MLFTDSINGNKIPLAHISEINVQGKQVIFKEAKGGTIVEDFDTEQEAQTRYNDLKKDLLE